MELPFSRSTTLSIEDLSRAKLLSAKKASRARVLDELPLDEIAGLEYVFHCTTMEHVVQFSRPPASIT
jgi:hypothetical protein